MPSLVEKRTHPRIRVSAPIRYQELNGNTYLAKGTLTKNLSEGGVRFKTDAFIPMSCQLVIEIKLPGSVKPIKAVSKIAWITKLPTGDDYETGNHFLAMSDADEKLLSDYLKTCL